MEIRKYILNAFLLMMMISILIYCIQGFNKYAYVLTKGNLPYVDMLFKGDLASDSWDPMHLAHDYHESNAEDSRIYSDNLLAKNIRFQYPPVTLIIPQFVKKLRIAHDVFYKSTIYCFMLVTSFILYKIVHDGIVHHTRAPLPIKELFLLFSTLFALSIVYFPVLQGAVFGNIQIWLNALFALSIYGMLKNKPLFSGMVIGLAATIKPQFGLLLVWSVVRKHWKFAKGFLAVFGLVSLIGVLVFSMENHIDYLNALSFLSQRGESYHHNQSLNGLLNRIFSVNYPNLYNNLGLIYLYQPFPPFNPWVYYPTIISSLIIIGLCLIFKRDDASDTMLIDYCLMALGLTLASPITWIYHYGVLLPIAAIVLMLFYFNRDETRDHRKLFKLFALCFVISGCSIPFVEYVYHTYLNVVQSYYYFAALGMFYVLYRLRAILSIAPKTSIANNTHHFQPH